jgi:hypothetical protein
MLSRLAYTIVGIVIVALSFGAMMFTLNLWSGYPIANAVSAAGMQPAPQLKSVSAAATETIPETPVEALPRVDGGGFQWAGIAHLHAEPQTGMSVVAGQPILKLVTTPQDGYHTIAGQFRGLSKNQVYRVTAWVKPAGGGNVEFEISDGAIGQPFNHAVAIFSLGARAVVSTDVAAKQRGIDQGPGSWRKVWLDMMTSNGDIIVTLRPAVGGGVIFKGDGQLGVILGGVEVEPQG